MGIIEGYFDILEIKDLKRITHLLIDRVKGKNKIIRCLLLWRKLFQNVMLELMLELIGVLDP